MNNTFNNNNDLNGTPSLNDYTQIKLSKRQKQVLEALNNGLIYKEIGHMHDISENTVAYHMMELRKKLSCKNSREILSQAKALGLI